MIGRKVLEKAIEWATKTVPHDGTIHGDLLFEVSKDSFVAGFEESFAILKEMMERYEQDT